MTEFEQHMFSMLMELKNEMVISLKKLDFRISNVENEMLKIKNEISTAKKNISDTSKRATLLQDEVNELQDFEDRVHKANAVLLERLNSFNNRRFMRDTEDVFKNDYDPDADLERKDKILVPLKVPGIMI